MSVTAVGEEPEPSKAELLRRLQHLEAQMVAGFAELRAMITGPVTPHPEVMPKGLDELPPMRGFMTDADDGL